MSLHANKRRRIEDDPEDLSLYTIHEVSLLYVKEGWPPIYQHAMKVAREIDTQVMKWELDQGTSADLSRFHGHVDQLQSAAHSIPVNLANGIGAARHGKRSISKYLEARGSLGECYAWLAFFQQEWAGECTKMLNKLEMALDEFIEYEDKIANQDRHRPKLSSTEFNTAYLTTPTQMGVPEPMVIGLMVNWVSEVHFHLKEHIAKVCCNPHWKLYEKTLIENLSKDTSTVTANMKEGWYRAGLKQNWNYLRVARGKFFSLEWQLKSLPTPFCDQHVEKWSQLRLEMDKYCMEILQAIVENNQPPFFKQHADKEK